MCRSLIEEEENMERLPHDVSKLNGDRTHADIYDVVQYTKISKLTLHPHGLMVNVLKHF